MIYDTDKIDKLHHIVNMYHYEQFELKLGMCGEGGLLTNFSEFHEDHANSTMFSQRSRKIYWTDLALCML